MAYEADDQIRTGDLILTKDALYRLSYISAFICFVQSTMVIIQRHRQNVNPISDN